MPAAGAKQKTSTEPLRGRFAAKNGTREQSNHQNLSASRHTSHTIARGPLNAQSMAMTVNCRRRTAKKKGNSAKRRLTEGERRPGAQVLRRHTAAIGTKRKKKNQRRKGEQTSSDGNTSPRRRRPKKRDARKKWQQAGAHKKRVSESSAICAGSQYRKRSRKKIPNSSQKKAFWDTKSGQQRNPDPRGKGNDSVCILCSKADQ